MLNKYAVRNRTYLLTPGAEAVTLMSRTSNATATFVSYAVPRGKHRPLTIAERSIGGGELSADSMLVEVYQESLDAATVNGVPTPAPRPKPGDVWVLADGTKWVVVPDGVEQRLLDQFFKCHCQQQIAGG